MVSEDSIGDKGRRLPSPARRPPPGYVPPRSPLSFPFYGVNRAVALGRPMEGVFMFPASETCLDGRGGQRNSWPAVKHLTAKLENGRGAPVTEQRLGQRDCRRVAGVGEGGKGLVTNPGALLLCYKQ